MFQIKYKETYMKDKEKAVGINMSDSKTLHSLQVAKMSSDVSTSPSPTNWQQQTTYFM